MSKSVLRAGAQRDPNRIPIILAKLQQLWLKYPDQRFGQIITNLNPSDVVAGLNARDIFYVEDDLLLEQIEKALENWG
jgi:hypothetical protein